MFNLLLQSLLFVRLIASKHFLKGEFRKSFETQFTPLLGCLNPRIYNWYQSLMLSLARFNNLELEWQLQATTLMLRDSQHLDLLRSRQSVRTVRQGIRREKKVLARLDKAFAREKKAFTRLRHCSHS